MVLLFKKLMQNIQFRFMLIGGLNTLIGYFVALGMYELFKNILHITIISIISAIINISISFIGQRRFVFKSTAPWLLEYLKMYVVNAVSTVIGIVLIWIAVDQLHYPFWLSQAIITVFIVIYLYFAHKYFTFKTKS